MYCVLQLISRWQGYLPIIALILVSGLSHYLYLKGVILFDIHQESVFLSVSGAISTVIIFTIYSIKGRPVIQTLAEQATPALKTLPVYLRILLRIACRQRLCHPLFFSAW
ncbi:MULTISPECIES: hypothetical protein [Pectobacterium]|uniref:hypothetical protein n=1 Tax=Pectobacterium TaxID=122277 RepID=UPI000A4FC36F|nr:hypothetical protein [Pectobacterium brasiliense]